MTFRTYCRPSPQADELGALGVAPAAAHGVRELLGDGSDEARGVYGGAASVETNPKRVLVFDGDALLRRPR
jgi:hypothetical protein